MKEKVVYIAHEMSGNVKENKKDVLRILREIHLSDSSVIPIASYLVAFDYLDDTVPEERALGMLANRVALFERRVMDETWIAGQRISSGMKSEIQLSLEQDIPVFCYKKSMHLQPALNKIIANHKKEKKCLKKE